MMKKNIISIVLIFSILIALIQPVYASFVELATETEGIETYSGKVIEVTLKLKNFQDVQKGINAFQATIEYDDNVFEPINENSFTLLNNWESFQYNSKNKTFVAIKKSGTTVSEDVAIIKLKVKENLKGQESIVKIKDFVASEGKEDIVSTETIETKVKIIEQSSQLPDDTSNGDSTSNTNNPSNGNNNSNNNNQVNNNQTNDNTANDSNNNQVNNNQTNDNTTNNSNNNQVNNNQTNDNTVNDSNNNNQVNNNQTNDNTVNDSNNNNQVNNDKTNNNIANNSNDNNQVAGTTSNNQNNTNNNTTSNGENNANKNYDNLSSKKIPYTGLTSKNKWILVVITIFVMIALISKQRENLMVAGEQTAALQKTSVLKKEKALKIIGTVLVVIILSLELTSAVQASIGKGELNGDGNIDYDDVALLESHLISLKQLADDKLDNADMNSDRYLTVTDLSLLIQKIEKKLDYQVEIIDVESSNYYPEKGEDISIRIYANTNYDTELESVTINGNEYAVTKEDDNGIYNVTFKAQDVAGIQELNFTEVKLDVGQTVKINYTEKIDVLKQMPSIENYTLEESAANSTMTVKFDFVDADNSKTNGSIVIYDSNSEKVDSKEIVVGKNELTFKAEEDAEYTVSICAEYNLDTDELTDHEEDHSGNLLKEETAKLSINYDLKFSNIKTYDESGEEKNTFEKGTEIVTSFESSNAVNLDVQSVIVDGNKYEVTKKADNKYEFTLSAGNEKGEKEFKISEVTLSNGKKIELTENNTIKVVISELKPTVTDEKFSEDSDNLSVNFKLNDEDETIKNASLIVTDENNTIIFQEDLTAGEYDKKIDLSKVFAKEYNIEVLATYENSGATLENQTIYEETIIAKTKVIVEDSSISKENVEKDESFKITYKVKVNKDEQISKVQINNQEVEVTKIDNNTYEVELQAPSSAGKISLNTTKFYVGEESAKVDVQNEVEVLKSKIVIDDYEVQDNTDDTVTVKFNVLDADNAFISGKVQLVKNSDETVVQEQNITKTGENEFKIPVEETVEYTLKVVINQGRDADKKSVVSEEVLLEKPIQYVRDYNLTIENLKVTKENGTKTSYFEKGEVVKFSFDSTNKTKFYPESVVINGEKYSLEKQDNTYTLELEAPTKAGITELKLEKIYMNNAKEFDFDSENTVKLEVLKEVPSVENFAYQTTEDDNIQITFDLIDSENTIESAKIKVQDGKGTVLKEEAITVGKNTVEVGLTTSENYTATILATYDLDTNTLDQNSNRYIDKEICVQEMTATKDAIELKDISNITLYKIVDNATEEIQKLDISAGIPTDTTNYIAKIEMSSLPTYYANIKEFKQDSENNKIDVVIDQSEFIMYEETEKGFKRQNEFSFEMEYIDKDGEHTSTTKADDFFAEIAKNLSGTYELTEDLDASNIESTVAIAGTFKGTLNGNGYKIINLPTVLFDKLNGATIKNLVIEDANITNNSKAVLANTVENKTTIESVHIKDSIINNNMNGVGAFTGGLTNSTIKNCSAISINIKANNTIGGICGQMSSGSTVEDCYVTGTIQGTISHNLGARVGGITGWDSGTLINHCYTKVNIIASSTTGNGGIIGGPNGANPTVTNCVSLSTGNAYRISGFNVLANASNVYEYSESNATTNINDDNSEKVKTITNLYSKSFYKDTLGFDESIWNLDIIEAGNLPNLKSDPMPNDLDSYEIMNNKNNIPNYEEIRKNSNYKNSNEILYYNMAQLMPYADTASIVEYGNTISSNTLIATQKIKFVLALNSENELIAGIETDNISDIKKIRVAYEDDESEVFTVEYSKTLDNIVAVYKVKELNVQYQFGNYIATVNETLVNELATKASEYDYAETISAITEETESRLYTDYYNESVKSKVKEIIENYIITNEEFATYNSNSYLQKQISDYMTEENVIKLIYAYNYYDKWYHINFDGIILSDVMFFNGTKINQDMTSNYLISSVCNTNEANRKTSATVTFYNNFLQAKTGDSLANFLANMMGDLNGYSDPNDWFAEHFDGILVEQKAYGASDEVIYRIWDLMSRRSHLILPVLTAPQEDMYMISVPSQIVLGSMNRYSTYLTKDGEERDRMKELITGYAEKIGNFYGTTAGILSNATQVFNSRVNIQYDTRFYFPESDKADAGTQTSGTTKDPVMKWVYEAIGSWGAANGSGAYANGTDVYWIVYQALGGDFSFSVFAHETAHNQDGAVFYGGAGRRSGTGAESHSDGNIRQEYGNGIMVFNFSYDLSITGDYTNNFSYKTINTPESIYKYYKEMFETKYVLDYLEAQAFLRLTPEEQAKVAVQAVQTSDGGSSMSTAYTRLTAEDFENMNLQTMEDLWDNQLCIRSVGTSVSADAYNYNQYGYESYYCVNWYQPHNDTGVTDCYSFKRLGQEMLGVAGYENGYIVWMSGKSSNDLDALRKITGDDDITFKEYKLGRYETVKENLSKISYFDYNEVIDEFETALKADAANNNLNSSINTQTLLYGIVKRATSDFTDGGIYETPTITSITSAKQLIELANKNTIGNYRLDADIDFSGIDVEEGETAYITNQFIGVLDGNGHKITGVEYPLFKSILYADVKNITISEPKYKADADAVIAITSSNSVLDTIKVENSELELPFIKTKNNRYYEYGENTSTIKENTINSLEEFLKIGDSASGGNKKRYILNTDIDLSSVTTTSQPIFNVSFTGRINGNGHTISNLNATLFAELNSATIENLNIENGTITGSYAKGILANTITSSTINKLYIKNISLTSSGTNGAGGLTGQLTSSSVKQTSLENVSISANNTIGGIAGQINNGTIENCLVTGTITGTEWSNGNGARIGGITGWFSSGTIDKCLTKVNIVNSRIIGNGGIIGGPSSGGRAIKNSISLSTGDKAYRLAGWTATLDGATNVYEYAESNSTTNITENNSANVKVATAENVKDINFYKNSLGWSEDIWDFSGLSSGNGPTLKK